MPQLSPLPWLFFFSFSLVSVLWVVMASEWILGEVELEKKLMGVEVCFEW